MLTILMLEASRNFGGQERRLLHEARLLKGAGHRPLLATPPDAALFRRGVQEGIEAFGVRMRNAVSPSAVLKLWSIVRRYRVDIIYSHSGKDSTLGGICSLLSGVPLVRSRELLTPVKHASSYNLLPKRVLACSEAVRRHLIDAGADEKKVFVQYPPVATAGFRDAAGTRDRIRKELHLDDAFPVLACVAGFRPEKRQEDLVRAMAAICCVFPAARLLLVGSGPTYEELRTLADSLGLADSVLFTGEREDVPSLLGAADIFVLPSSLEPFGMSPVEAMAAGVPVVVTATGGLAEIVTDGSDGLHAPVCSPDGLAEAVLRLARDPGLRERLVAAGKKRAAHFDESAALGSLVQHFNAVIAAS